MKEKMEQGLKTFYMGFKQSSLYNIIAILIILIGLLFFPTGRIIANMFSRGPFVAGPYISLSLMLIVFILYTRVYLYVFVVFLFLFSSFISFIGIAMGSISGREIIVFFLPIILFLILNIFLAVFSYGYKKEPK